MQDLKVDRSLLRLVLLRVVPQASWDVPQRLTKHRQIRNAISPRPHPIQLPLGFKLRSSVSMRGAVLPRCASADVSAFFRASSSFIASTVTLISFVEVSLTVAVNRFGRGLGFGFGRGGLRERALVRGGEMESASASYLMPTMRLSLNAVSGLGKIRYEM